MLNNIIINDNKIQIGGYILPADFKYLEIDFLGSLQGKEFSTKVEEVYFKLTGKVYNFNKNVEIFMVDDTICALDLASNRNANYLDVIDDNEDFSTKIYTLVSIFTACYVDLVDSGIIKSLEKVNFALPSDDGIFLLSLFIAKKIGLPIDTIICGGDVKTAPQIKGLYFKRVNETDIEDFIGIFFDEYDMALDPISVKGIVAMDGFYESYEDENVTVYLNLSSPYLFARKVLNIVSGEKILDVYKAIDKLYFETSQDIPESIKNKEIPLYYVENIKMPLDIAISFINAYLKV